jgi:Glycosyl transferase family 2
MKQPADPRVSVIMPAYQSQATVAAAVSSVLWQTYSNIELVVVDDGSTDATAAIVRGFGKRVRLIEQPNAGVSAARNRGLEEATGELISFCDSDDVLFANHMAALVAEWQRRGGIVTANAYWMFPDGVVPGRTVHRGRFPAPHEQRMAILQRNFVSPMSIVPRPLIDELGGFDPEFEVAEDLAFWLKMIFAGHPIALQPQPFALYRWSTSGLSTQAELLDASVTRVLEQTSERPDLTDAERDYLGMRRSMPAPSALVREADAALRARRYREAAKALRGAAELLPVEDRLVWKARILALAPWLTGPIVRARVARVGRVTGLEGYR